MPLDDKLGICQWFHYEDYAAVERCVAWLRDLRVRRLRTGISWADFHRPGGRAWYNWQMQQLREFDILLSIWHTPPSIAEGGVCAAPPRRLADFADFCCQAIELYGDTFEHLELWNEPNNTYKWDFLSFDPEWAKFGEMIRLAAAAARPFGKPTVLGGMMPVDARWLELMESYGALEQIDVVAIHGFPHMWWPGAPSWDVPDRWRGWQDKIDRIAAGAAGRSIWISETGLATWQLEGACEGRLDLQSRLLRQAATAPAERVYWYCLVDLDPRRTAIEGFHVDENEYHMGLLRHDGSKKPAYDVMKRLLRGERQES